MVWCIGGLFATSETTWSNARHGKGIANDQCRFTNEVWGATEGRPARERFLFAHEVMWPRCSHVDCKKQVVNSCMNFLLLVFLGVGFLETV